MASTQTLPLLLQLRLRLQLLQQTTQSTTLEVPAKHAQRYAVVCFCVPPFVRSRLIPLLFMLNCDHLMRPASNSHGIVYASPVSVLVCVYPQQKGVQREEVELQLQHGTRVGSGDNDETLERYQLLDQRY